MISFEAAQAILKSQPHLSESVSLPVGDAIGRTCAVDVLSPESLPAFRNSAMDGYALRAEDVSPEGLSCIGTQIAGEVVALPDDVRGTCLRINTGAQVPEVYDTVVPVEQATTDGNRVYFTAPIRQGSHIRLAGEDVAAGGPVLRAGNVMTPERVMLCAALGINTVAVYKRPPLYVFSTGNEVGTATATSIRDSNSPYLIAAAKREHLSVTFGAHIGDDPDALRRVIASVPAGAIIVTTGGVSAGTHDFIPDTLKSLGADILFHKVSQKPGKPILFSRLPNGSYVFGLPGNPASAAVGFRFFVLSLLRALEGRRPETPLTARLTAPFSRKPGLTQFLKARLSHGPEGLNVAPLDGQESFRINSLAAANAFIRLPERGETFAEGQRVDVFLFDGNSPFAEDGQ